MAIPGRATDLPLPDPLPLVGHELSSRLVEVLGYDGNPAYWDFGRDISVMVADRQLFVLHLDSPRGQVIGRLLLPFPVIGGRVHLIGNRLAVPTIEDQVLVVDLETPSRPRLVAPLLIGGRLRFSAASDDRLYLLREEVETQRWWLRTVEFDDRTGTRGVTEVELIIEDVEGLLAGPRHVAIASEYAWEVYDLVDAADPILVLALRDRSSAVLELRGDVVLIAEQGLLTVLDLAALPVRIEHAYWQAPKRTLEFLGAQAVGQGYRAVIHLDGEAGGRDVWQIHRLESLGSPALQSIESSEIPRTRLLFGAGQFCFEQLGHNESGRYRCLDQEGKEAEIIPSILDPEGEYSTLGSKFSVPVIWNDELWVQRYSQVQRLGHDSTGLLRARPSPMGPGGSSAAQFAVLDDQLFARSQFGTIDEWHLDSQGFELRRIDVGSDVWWADWIAGLADRLIAVRDSPSHDGDLVIWSIDPRNPRPLEEPILVEGTLRQEPIVADRSLYTYRFVEGWTEVSLDEPSRPVVRRFLPGLGLAGLAVEAGIAYAARLVVEPGQESRILLESFDLDEDPPELLGSVALRELPVRDPTWIGSIQVAGEVVYVQRDGDWLSRVDVRDPRRPRWLEPVPLAAERFKMSRVGDRVAIEADYIQLGLLPNIVESSGVFDDVWSPWAPRWIDGIEVHGDLLLIYDSETTSRGRVGRWTYRIRSPLRPERGSRLHLDGPASEMKAVGSSLFALAFQGHELRRFDLAEDGFPVPSGKWCVPDGRCADNLRTIGAGNLKLGSPMRHFVPHGDVVFAMTDADELLHVIDVANPLRASIPTISRMPGLHPGMMQIVGDRLIVLADGSPPYQIDIREPAMPRPVGPIEGLALPITRMKSDGGALLAITNAKQLLILEFRDGEAPVVLSRYDLEDAALDLDFAGDRLFIRLAGELWILSVGGSEPVQVMGHIPLAGTGQIAIRGEVVYHRTDHSPLVDVLAIETIAPDILPQLWLPWAGIR